MRDRLIIGDAENNVAVISLWSKGSEIAKQISPKNYACLGNLFSAERGLDLLVRNLLANPQITDLVVTGVDLSNSGVVLRDFFERGFKDGNTKITEKPVWVVDSKYPGYIGKDIPKELLEELKKTIKVTSADSLSGLDFSKLKNNTTRQQHIIPKPEEKEETKKYFGEDGAYSVRGKTIAETWLRILDTIMKFGRESDTHYDMGQKEIIDLVSVVTEEDPNNWHIPGFLPHTKEHVMEYLPTITTNLVKDGTSYTYGSRMRSWFGSDQVERAIKKLSEKTISRAVVISLWDPSKDLEIGGSPCINHIWLRIRDDRLYMTTTIRSNDMFEGWPENAFGLRALQELIRKRINEELKKQGNQQEIKLGDMITVSQSAHIYKDCYERALGIIGKYYDKYIPRPEFVWDPRGNFAIDIEGSNIIVQHLTPDNEPLGVYKGTTAEELRDKICREGILGNTESAVYLGKELMKAEIAIKLKIHYNQDKPLRLEEIRETKK